MVAIESGEVLTLARGTASTINGIAQIFLPEHFSLVTSDSVPVTVIVTPEKVPAVLFVKEKSKSVVEIGMKSQDYYEFGDVTFSYQVTGVRDGFEHEQVIIDAESINSANAVEQDRNAVKNRIKANMNKAKVWRHAKR